MINLFEKIKNHKGQNLPFVIYSKPNSDKIIGIFQKNDNLYELENFEEKGFVFAPFNDGITCLIPIKNSEFISETYHLEKNDFKVALINSNEDESSQKRDFEQLVDKAIQNIKSGYVEKIVVSRKEVIAIDFFDIETVFEKLLSLYHSAFKYCFYHPKIGLWIGATPEQFLKIKDNMLQTVALAGTRLENENEWGEKEKMEQQYVTNFIVSNIKQFVSNVEVSNPYTVKAGTLEHIKTDIIATVNSLKDKENIIKKMHPTPAVCGLPKDKSKDFILKNENYNRKYYTGYLGELNFCLDSNDSLMSDLFVNLRCMEIKETTAEVFVGCGITKDSNPQLEYLETKNKSETMKRIL